MAISGNSPLANNRDSAALEGADSANSISHALPLALVDEKAAEKTTEEMEDVSDEGEDLVDPVDPNPVDPE